MNRFRERGSIGYNDGYNGEVRVQRSLLNKVFWGDAAVWKMRYIYSQCEKTYDKKQIP